MYYMWVCIWLYVYDYMYIWLYVTIYIYIYMYTPCTTRQAQFWWSSKCQKSLAETTLFRFSGPKVEDGWNFSQIARAPAEMMGDRSAISSTWATWIPKKKYPYISYKKRGVSPKMNIVSMTDMFGFPALVCLGEIFALGFPCSFTLKQSS